MPQAARPTHTHGELQSEEYFYMRNKEEFLFLYMCLREDKTEPKFLGEGSDKDFIVDLKPL